MSHTHATSSNEPKFVNRNDLQILHDDGTSFDYTVLSCPAGEHGHDAEVSHVFVAPYTGDGTVGDLVRGTKLLRATCGNTTYSALNPWLDDEHVSSTAETVISKNMGENVMPNDLINRFQATKTDALTWAEPTPGGNAEDCIVAYSNTIPTTGREWKQSARAVQVFAGSVHSPGSIWAKLFNDMRESQRANMSEQNLGDFSAAGATVEDDELHPDDCAHLPEVTVDPDDRLAIPVAFDRMRRDGSELPEISFSADPEVSSHLSSKPDSIISAPPASSSSLVRHKNTKSTSALGIAWAVHGIVLHLKDELDYRGRFSTIKKSFKDGALRLGRTLSFRSRDNAGSSIAGPSTIAHERHELGDSGYSELDSTPVFPILTNQNTAVNTVPELHEEEHVPEVANEEPVLALSVVQPPSHELSGDDQPQELA